MRCQYSWRTETEHSLVFSLSLSLPISCSSPYTVLPHWYTYISNTMHAKSYHTATVGAKLPTVSIILYDDGDEEDV